LFRQLPPLLLAHAKRIWLAILVWVYWAGQNVAKTPEKTYIVKFIRTEMNIQTVIAARAEIRGDHLVFLNSDGELAATFLLKMIESVIKVSG
jgi:hypothetical protein